MPLHGSYGDMMRELYADNKKKGKERGANGKKRSRKQMQAIAYHEQMRQKMMKKV